MINLTLEDNFYYNAGLYNCYIFNKYHFYGVYAFCDLKNFNFNSLI